MAEHKSLPIEVNYDQHILLRIKTSIVFDSISKGKYVLNKHKKLANENPSHTKINLTQSLYILINFYTVRLAIWYKIPFSYRRYIPEFKVKRIGQQTLVYNKQREIEHGKDKGE